MNKRPWQIFALITTLSWGIWGAFIELPEKNGFPATLGYVVWALTMIPCALVALGLVNWRLDRNPRSIFLGSVIGFTGAGGQLILFQALREGPAYIVFPVISLYPVVTIFLSMLLLRERASRRGAWGIAIALIAMVLLSYTTPSGGQSNGYWWLLLAIIVFFCWGVQAYFMKSANNSMQAESIFFYMTITGLLLIPVAWFMTDFSQPINRGLNGPWLAAGIQILNAIGALTLVYALRYGKAIIVVPVTALAPVITIIISLILYSVVPHPVTMIGLLLAAIAIYLMAE